VVETRRLCEGAGDADVLLADELVVMFCAEVSRPLEGLVIVVDADVK
jgi:hypothetical protein